MSAFDNDDFIDAELFTPVNIAKYDQNIDYLLYVPENINVPANYKSPPLTFLEEKHQKKKTEQQYSFIPLFDLPEEEVKVEKVSKTVIPSPYIVNGLKVSSMEQILKLLPKDVNFFYDVFSGSSSVGVNTNAKVIVCLDTNSVHVQILKYLQRHTYEELARKLDFLAERYGLSNSAAFGYAYYNSNSNDGLSDYNREPYLNLRSDYNHLLNQLKVKNYLQSVNGNKQEGQESLKIKNATKEHTPKLVFNDDMLIRVIMLIIYGFNNFARFNHKGLFNLPVGKRDFSIKVRERYKDYLNLLNSKHIDFAENNFSDLDINQLIQEQAFLYFNPPCVLNEDDLQNSWSFDLEAELYSFLEDLNKNGLRFAVSTFIQFQGKYNYRLLDWCHSNRFNINFIQGNNEEESFATRTLEVVITNYING
ncbi:hypothetical protein CKF54_03775 [Psittacicella hinzii]|uniref:site-specific DNA-methyltransferase (adenine-specific) n=1 Tax=Psittacicella hinzii TaxID=2028575 RepID=A0A3A1Y6M0_9GAMM|nr:DNA adenine methylase [Psittacicella hinzii]RIY32930.1 hypothetical protein CKF54_03775 [Psittacicella hinzii]